jgi:hexosaminidase
MQWWQSVSALLLTISPVIAIWPAPANMTTGDNVLWLDDTVLVTYNGSPV